MVPSLTAFQDSTLPYVIGRLMSIALNLISGIIHYVAISRLHSIITLTQHGLE